MFDNNRYITAGIQNKLPSGLIMILFGLIDKLKTKAVVDYLQVFNINTEHIDGICKYKIKHYQEKPAYEEYVELDMLDEIELEDCKVFVIDDISHSTMLLAEEY